MSQWRWLMLLVLVYGLGFSSAGKGERVRHRRQSQWRQPPLRSVLWKDSARLGPIEVGQGLPVQFEGFQGRLPMHLIQSFSLNSPVTLQCGEGIMVVIVQRDLFGNGRLVEISDLNLGTKPCKPGSKSTDAIAVFDVNLQDCGIDVKMTLDFIIYSTNLTYNPTAPNSPITRTNRAVVPIQCFYPRHGNVSSKAIQPTWIPFTTTISSEEKLSFTLQLMTDDWTSIRPSFFFSLGDVLHIEASVDSQNHIPLILYVDSCVATITPDAGSSPRYEIIAHQGCLVDGMEADVSSSFRSPRIQADKLQFTVDAFRFLDEEQSEIYITCDLKAVPTSEIPNAMIKACSYDKASNSWFPVEGPTDICQCCNAGNCELLTGQPRRWGSVYGKPRGIEKREANGASAELFSKVAIGPLVIRAESLTPQPVLIPAHLTSTESQPVEFWVLVSVVSVSLVVVVIGVCFIGKRIS